MSVRIRVDGIPAPQGSKSAFKVGDRVVLAEGGSKVGRAKHKAWRAAVSSAALEQVPHHRRIDDTDDSVALRVVIDFWMPRPKTVRRPLPSVKPDLDKLIRSTLDGLADGLVFKHDSRVVELDVTQEYASRQHRPGAHVTVEQLAPADRPDS